ncbi:MAG TPA: FAD:protein FMN transferase [Rudaea sp.]
MDAFRFEFSTMGCPCALHLETDARTAQRAFDAARAECERLDRKYSHYRDDSLIATIAARGGGAPIEVDTETADLFDFANELHRQSGGLFDITAGALTRLWDLRSGDLPARSAIESAVALVGWERVEWQRPHVRMPSAAMRLDLGGIVKEYAADRCAQICREAGVAHGLVDLSGDLAVIGPHRDGSAWRVGIKAPRAPGQAAAQIAIDSGGLATSGDYERVLIVDGRRYSHIVDPRSGWPVEGLASVSVVAQSCLVAGAASTLAMLMGADGVRWLGELGLPHLCIDTDGRIFGTLSD